MTNKENVLIKFNMLIKIEDKSETISKVYKGIKSIKNNKTYIIYDEIEKQNIVKTNIIISDGVVSIRRNGNTTMSTQYSLNKKIEGIYKNQFITMTITTETKKLEINEHSLYINYNLYNNEEKLGNYSLTIEIEREA